MPIAIQVALLVANAVLVAALAHLAYLVGHLDAAREKSPALDFRVVHLWFLVAVAAPLFVVYLFSS